MFRYLLAVVVTISLFTLTAPPAEACRVGAVLKAIGHRAVHPLEGRRRRG